MKKFDRKCNARKNLLLKDKWSKSLIQLDFSNIALFIRTILTRYTRACALHFSQVQQFLFFLKSIFLRPCSFEINRSKKTTIKTHWYYIRFEGTLAFKKHGELNTHYKTQCKRPLRSLVLAFYILTMNSTRHSVQYPYLYKL